MNDNNIPPGLIRIKDADSETIEEIRGKIKEAAIEIGEIQDAEDAEALSRRLVLDEHP